MELIRFILLVEVHWDAGFQVVSALWDSCGA